jgi:hypothetical protein
VASTAGNGAVDRGKIIPLSSLGVTPQPVVPAWVIVGGNAWPNRSELGLFNAAQQQADPAHYAMAGFVPLHRGDWRRSIGVEIMTPDSHQVSLRLPISMHAQSWLTETSSETSPMSVNEHEPGLSTTYSRRVWGLVLATPTLHPKVESRNPAAGPFYEARLLYGVVGLDRYKDFVLHWPDKGTSYPRVIVTPGQLPRFIKALDSAPATAAALKNFYFVGKNDEVARKEVDRLKKQLGDIADYIVSTATMGHHQVWMDAVAMADDVLSWPGLSAADRDLIRADLALITYLHVDADVMGHGEGSHLGNPNMSISRQSEMCDFMALLPDHPMAEQWRNYMARFLAYKFGCNMAPGGGWFEFGAAYHMHSMMKMTRAIFGLTSAGAPLQDELYAYLEPTWRYYLNLLTPYDSRWYSRVIPGEANSQPAYPAEFSEPAGLLADRDPAFASNLQWAWDDNGRPMMGGDMVPYPFLARPWVKPVAPQLHSEIYPGVGVVFRAHQGPDETYLFMRSGYNWSHWYSDDQNNLTLMSRGALLLPYQPFQYYSRDTEVTDQDLDAFNLYNTIRFGSPKNQYAFGWPDTNVLDHAFGNSVDYAWSSTGFPDWYIQPAHRKGYGEARLLEGDASQQQGAFQWNRQVMFLKGLTATSPNYFVFRDSESGPGKLANWFNLDLLGKSTGVAVQGNNLAVDTEFATKLGLLFPAKKMLAPVMVNTFMGAGIASPSFRPWIERAAGKPVSPNWVRSDGQPASAALPPNREQHVLVRLAGAPGEVYFWVAYPHLAGEALPAATQLQEGAMKIVTPESTDYVFMAAQPLAYQGNDVSFSGCAGAVRVRANEVVLALTGGSGHVGYKGYVLQGTAPLERTIKLADLKRQTEKVAAPHYAIGYRPRMAGSVLSVAAAPGVTKTKQAGATIYEVAAGQPVHAADGDVRLFADRATVEVKPGSVRMVVPGRSYAELSVGTVGVRGVGPFDLTLTDNDVTGTVDGDTRTLVLSKPKGIVRPMYHVDGVRWYAGFPDDDAPYREATSPQYSLALGVTGGAHQVSIAEWTYPALPPTPQRRTAF